MISYTDECCTDDLKKFQNKENIMNNCDKWRIKDVKNCSGSEDMFSDDDQLRNSHFNSPKVSLKNDTLESPSLLLKTPTLLTKISEETPGRAIVPKTPLGLVPLLTKTDTLWTSEMETPENKNREKSESCDKNKTLVDMNTTPHHALCSPTFEKTIVEKMDTTSPVLGGKKRSKKRAKRRLLNNAVLDLDNVDQQSSISSSSDRVPSDVASTVSNDFVDIDIEYQKQTEQEMIVQPINIDECNSVDAVVTLEKNSRVLEKNINTSTQEFFSNASFSCIDNLCLNVIQEEKTNSPIAGEFQNHKFEDQIKKETKNETGLENDNIEKRVAAIKRNQKIIRRSSDINHTVIPKEIFSKSVRDLDLADAKFSQENKKTPVLFDKTTKSSSFIPLSSLENENIVDRNVSNDKNEEICNWFDDWNPDTVENKIKKGSLSDAFIKPANEIMDANCTIKREMNCTVDSLLAKISNEKLVPVNQSDNTTNKVENISNTYNKLVTSMPSTSDEFQNGFSTASGKTVSIDEDKLRDYAKIYSEIENEDLNENSFFMLKKQNKPKRLQLNFKNKNTAVSNLTENRTNSGIQTVNEKKSEIKVNKEKPAHTLHTINNSKDSKNDNSTCVKDLIKSNLNSLIPSEIHLDIQNIENFSDGFSTARGKNIQINEEKENFYSKIYDEFNDSDENSFLNIKKNRTSRLSFKKPLHKPLVKFNEKEINKNQASTSAQANVGIKNNQDSNGFSTAGGKNIKINETKESYYSKIYDELENCDENSLLNLKKNKISKLSLSRKQTEKSLINFKDKPIAQKETLPSDTLIKPNQEKLPQQALNAGFNQIKKEVAENQFFANNDVDEIFCNSEDFEDILVPPDQNKKPNFQETNHDNSDPNLSETKKINNFNFIKGMDAPKEVKIKKENLSENLSTNVIGCDYGKVCKKEFISRIESLKRKLDACDVKRPERCRSFGGFSANEDVSASKLNKSDPDELLVNQPLQKNLSISQCFDSHSDSWLSKIEISHLNENKSLSPDSMKKNQSDTASTPPENSENFVGFASKECVESFNRYASVKKIFEKLKQFSCSTLSLKSGETISICNKTFSEQKLFVQFKNNIHFEKDTEKSNYNILETNQKTYVPKNIKVHDNLVKRTDGTQRIVEKRKHPDTDSDTPITTLKKPRVGSELQGRKLFSDEEDSEESNYNFGIPVNCIDDSQTFDALKIITPPEDDLSEERMCAIKEQEKIIKNKKLIKVKPIMGCLLSERQAKSGSRTSWSDLVGNAVPRHGSINEIKKKHPDTKIVGVSATNAIQYKFLSSNITGNKKVVSISVGDEATLIFDENGHAGVDEFTEAFLAMPGVDPKLLPTGWIENHYRWIIWKLAAIDRMTFGSTQLPKMLVPDRVMKELKYRYDREIDRAQRPALRKILEKDDVPSRRLVLCISSIKENTIVDETDKEVVTKLGLPRWKVEASDGWYSIPLSVDNLMENFISTGKLKEGTKIITYGAELLDCDRGFFPLEKPANVSLKIYTNCTRRAKWDTKLGYQMISRPIPVKLRDILASGGMVGETTAAVARLYPLLYREKTADGQSIYRNARSEEKAAAAYERSLEKKVDAMYAEAEKNFDSRKKSDSDEDTQSTQGRENDRNRMKEKLESRVREVLPPPRQVTAVLKCRLVADKTTVILTIWGANDDSSFDIKEGDTITVYNCFAMGTRGGDLNLTANRASHIKKETLFKLPCPSRTCILIPEISGVGFEPKFNEFDTVGVVVSSGPAPNGLKNFEVVNLAYPRPDEVSSSYLSILFWNGISSFGYQGMFTAGSLVACSNLEWRRNTSWSSVPVAYCSEKSIFTCNPRHMYLTKELRDLKTLVKNPISYAESCSEEVSTLSKRPQQRSNQGTPTVSTSFLLSSSNSTSPAEFYSPSNKNVQHRLEKLSRYGTTVDMSPIVLQNSSTRVKKDFTPVTRPKT